MLVSLVSVMTLVLLSAAPDPQGPTCRSIDSHVACGYQCKSDGQRVRCAQTPQGRCQVVDGQAVCFDPPAHIVRLYGDALPEPECKTIDGQVACGYQCATQFGKVKCARTPAGMCAGRSDEIVCFDPPPEVYAVYGRDTPKAECRGNGPELACGYKCTLGAGKVACSKTPLGVCRSDGLRLTCFDPPAHAFCAWGKSLPPLQCQLSDNQPVCGYGCTKAYSKVACSATPKGMCKVFDSEVFCFDPPTTEDADPACLSLVGLATMTAP
ncbi:MAG TPA: hypothetical protein VF794_20340 [Archangium sp.]|uniref:hypothetical protein n=1 Tax=Archangium sp. TaxID=1872627 RepID=UPI002EDB1424